MKSLKLISFLMVVASTLLSSCLLLEPSPLFSSTEHWYDEFDEFVDVDENDEIDEIVESKITIEFFYKDELDYSDGSYYYEEAGCSQCICVKYQRSIQKMTNCRCYNPVCVCGHSRASHMIATQNKIATQKPPLPVERPRFEVFVPYNDIIATYKEAVDVAPNIGAPDAVQKKEVFINPLYVPDWGGTYEFEYVNETFYISSVYDSSMWPVDSSLSTLLFKSVKSLSYNGSYYRISCNRGTHTWKIEVDPMPISDEPETRSIYVLMWTSSHNYNFIFQFEQSNFEEF